MNAHPSRSSPCRTAELDPPRIDLSGFAWYARWKLTWILCEIDGIERRLGDEFGSTETAPLNAEHVALIEERDTLISRLASPVGETVTA